MQACLIPGSLLSLKLCLRPFPQLPPAYRPLDKVMITYYSDGLYILSSHDFNRNYDSKGGTDHLFSLLKKSWSAARKQPARIPAYLVTPSSFNAVRPARFILLATFLSISISAILPEILTLNRLPMIVLYSPEWVLLSHCSWMISFPFL
jgi:hypothetical protein